MRPLPSVRPRGRRAALAALAGTALLAAVGVTGSANAASVSPPTRLKAAGPINGDNGFPVWYKDSSNLSLGLCLDNENPLCGGLAAEMPDPTQPVSFPDNYPAEAFYMLADSTLALPSGPAVLTTGLEAAFATEDPAPGEQVVFGRVRIRITAPQIGHYKVTHPYGVDEFDVTTLETRNINFVEDIGIGAQGDFTGALKSRVDPFLRWDTGFFIGPDGASYLGNPDVAHRVTGSSLGTNFFRIEGPNIGGPGINVVTQDLFTLQGKVATNAGVAPQSVTYTRTSADGGYLDVFATSQPDQSIEVSGSGVSTTRLRGDAEGRYFGRVSYSGSNPPPSVKVSNSSDRPRTDVEVTVTDQVLVTSAVYDTGARTLAVRATSSDGHEAPALTVQGFGPLGSDGTATFSMSGALPPASVTVTSGRSGADTAPVTVTGGALEPDHVVAQTPPSLLVQQGQQVLLDGSASQNATSYAWTQVGGTPSVTIANAGSPLASFVAPATATTLTFRLTAAGPGGPSTADTQVTIQRVAPPIANAGAPQSVLQGSTVTLDASGSQGATGYSWTQTGGPAVTLNGRTTARPTFTMPATNDPLMFQVTVTGPGGSDVAVAQVSPRPDVLTVDQAEYRTSKGEWRISGTASITTGNQVTVYIGGTPGTGTRVGAPATVDALGVWSIRLNGPNPGAVRVISLTSSRGGSLAGAPLVVRN